MHVGEKHACKHAQPGDMGYWQAAASWSDALLKQTSTARAHGAGTVFMFVRVPT